MEQYPKWRSDRPPPMLAPEPSEPHFVRSERPERHGVKRALTIVGAVLGTGVTLVVATAAGALLHIGLPPARRLAAAGLNQALASSFHGKIEVERIGSLAPNGAGGVVATIAAPDGKRVLLVEGLRAKVRLPKLVWSMIAGDAMEVDVTELSIDHVDALLEQDENGALTITDALQPAKEGPPKPPDPKAKKTDLAFESIGLKHAWIHGGMAAVPVIDADLDGLDAAFSTTAKETRVALRRLKMSTRGLPKRADVGAELEASLVLPAVNATDDMDASLSFVGVVGGIDVDLHATKDGKKVDAVLAVPRVTPADLDRVLGSSPIHDEASARFEAHGTLPAIDPQLHVAIGSGTLDVGGHVVAPIDGQKETRAAITLAARGLQTRSFAAAASAPSMAIGADGRFDARMGEAGPAASGAIHLDVPGSPADATFAYRAGAIDFDARVLAKDLSRVAFLDDAAGRAYVHAHGDVGLAAKEVSAHVETQVDDFARGSIALHHAVLDGMVHGTFAAPIVAFNVDGQGLTAGSVAIPTFGASVHGAPDDALVAAQIKGQGKLPDVAVQARVHAKGGFEAQDVEVDLTRGKDRVCAKVADVRSKNGALDVDGLRVEGAGDPLVGEAHVKHGSIAVKLASRDLDLPTLMRVAGKDASLQAGHASIDVDLTASRRASNGHVTIDVKDASLANVVRGMNATVNAELDGRDARLAMSVSDKAFGELRVESENAKLGGGLLDPRAITDATGRAHVRADLDLEKLAKNWVGEFPLSDAAGRLEAKIDLARDDAAKRPSVQLAASTHQLAFTTRPKTVPQPDGTVVVVGKAFHTEKVDFDLKAALDAETGKTSFDAALKDPSGPLLTADASTTLPMTAILAGGAKTALLHTPMRVHADLPIRDIEKLPPALGPQPVRGSIGAAIDFDGTAHDPRFVLLARARDIRDADDTSPIPVTFDTAVTYDGKMMRTHVVAVRPEGKVLDAQANLALRTADLLDGKAPNWDADAKVLFSKFPVGSIADFAKEEIDADLSGTISVKGLHKAAALDANLDLSHVEVEGAKFEHASATLKARDGVLAASARIEDKDSYADVRARGAMTWGTEVAPKPDTTKPAYVSFIAHDFRAAAIAPFLQGVFSELDARVNADTKLTVKPGYKDGTMSGAIVVDHGTFESPAVGEEFHDVKAKIIMRPWGVWRVDDLEAQGVTGKLRANALAHVDGLQLRSAEAHVAIDEKEKIPLTVQGSAFGSAWGKVDVTAKVEPQANRMDVDVHVPHLEIDLPQTTPHGVQSLADDPTVKVGVYQKDGRIAVLPLDQDDAKKLKALADPEPPKPKKPPTEMRVVARLDDIVVKRDTTMKVFIKGQPQIVIDDKTTMSGQIHVPRGFIELQGKKFVIEKGLVNFTGQEQGNPIVIATAKYTAPDGTVIFADFVGPVKTGKVTLRSEPALSQDEILSVLLFGSADGTFGSSPPPGQDENGAAKAAGLAGGVVTQGLNKALSGVSGVEVSTKVDTSESQNPRPEIQVGLSERVSATVTYNLGVPPPGQNPDSTLLTVDWRFHKGWSTAATIGDKGTSILDFTWKYRY